MGGFFGGGGAALAYNVAFAIVDDNGTLVAGSQNVDSVTRNDVGDYSVIWTPGTFSVAPAVTATIRSNPVVTAGINTTRCDSSTVAGGVLTVNGGTGAVGDQGFMIVAVGLA
jgi:hypothetical protein